MALIAERVELAKRGESPWVITKLPSGWVVMGDVQFLPGYCLLLADPVVPSLNDLSVPARTQFMQDMVRIGDALLAVTDSFRVNYEILGNSEPELHAHIFPRYKSEDPERRRMPAWFYDWQAAVRYSEEEHGSIRRALRERLRTEAQPLARERTVHGRPPGRRAAQRLCCSSPPRRPAAASRSARTLGRTSPMNRVTFAGLAIALLLVACKSETSAVHQEDGPVAIYGTRRASSPLAADPPVVPLGVDMQATEQFVRLAYGLTPSSRFESTQFLTPELRTIQAQQLVRLVGKYNEFDGEAVADALLRFRGRVSGVEFGREGSPVLYIWLPFWTHQREELVADRQGVRIAEAENAVLVAELRSVFVGQLKADEFSHDQRRVRIWWD